MVVGWGFIEGGFVREGEISVVYGEGYRWQRG